uniref:B30.2/SPRY domain-containing protein n=1 Tax=Knipowitschia caucasica TaxID=637954 RepID=A0AAV2MFC0_KNICA
MFPLPHCLASLILVSLWIEKKSTRTMSHPEEEEAPSMGPGSGLLPDRSRSCSQCSDSSGNNPEKTDSSTQTPAPQKKGRRRSVTSADPEKSYDLQSVVSSKSKDSPMAFKTTTASPVNAESCVSVSDSIDSKEIALDLKKDISQGDHLLQEDQRGPPPAGGSERTTTCRRIRGDHHLQEDQRGPPLAGGSERTTTCRRTREDHHLQEDQRGPPPAGGSGPPPAGGPERTTTCRRTREDHHLQEDQRGPPPAGGPERTTTCRRIREDHYLQEDQRGPVPAGGPERTSTCRRMRTTTCRRTREDHHLQEDQRGPPPAGGPERTTTCRRIREDHHLQEDQRRSPPAGGSERTTTCRRIREDHLLQEDQRGPPPAGGSERTSTCRRVREDHHLQEDQRGPPPAGGSERTTTCRRTREDQYLQEDQRGPAPAEGPERKIASAVSGVSVSDSIDSKDIVVDFKKNSAQASAESAVSVSDSIDSKDIVVDFKRDSAHEPHDHLKESCLGEVDVPSAFQHLQKKIHDYVNSELKDFERLVSEDCFHDDNNSNELHFEEENKPRRFVLDLTLHMLKKMNLEPLAETLKNRLLAPVCRCQIKSQLKSNWITAKVMNDILRTGEGQLPQTLTELYIHFLVVQAKSTKVLLSGCRLDSSGCEALASVLGSQCRLRELDLSHNLLQDSGTLKLCEGLKSPVCALQTLRLNFCGLSASSCEALASVLVSETNRLKELDLSNNDVLDSGVKTLSSALMSPHCKLETLRLSGCQVSKSGCASLISALKSEGRRLKELDLSYNHPGEAEAKKLNDLFNDTQMKLSLQHGGKERLQGGFKKYAHPIVFDINTAHKQIQFSDDNRTISLTVKQSYLDHFERFENWKQVMCTEGLRGRRYWEVEFTGDVYIAVTYKSLKRKGRGDESCFGKNSHSWSLGCTEEKFSVLHKNRRLSFKQKPSTRVGVYLDWEGGALCFYDTSSDQKTHLHTYRERFTEEVYPAFRIKTQPTNSSVTLCTI